MYYGEVGGENVENLIDGFSCVTSEYSVLELSRAVSKRLNVKEITSREAEALEAFIPRDIHQLRNTRKLKLLVVTWRLIRKAYFLIRPYNLFASDALHLATALSAGAKLLVVDDYYFTRFRGKLREPQSYR